MSSSKLKRGWKIIRNLAIDLRYGALFGKTIKSRFKHLGAANTSSTDYAALPYIFNSLVKPDDVLVDVGCGRGRVIRWWLGQGLKNRIIGIELDPEVAKYAHDKTKKYSQVTIREGNLLDNIPEDGTIFYMYNPFGREVVDTFRSRLQSLDDSSKRRLLIYYNCKYVDLFENDPAWKVEKINLTKISTLFHRLAYIRQNK